MPLHLRKLYTFVDSAYLHGRAPFDIALSLADGGSDVIQLRAKDWPKERIHESAQRIAPALQDRGVTFVINDHIDIAKDVGAPLAHLGQEDFFDAGFQSVDQIIDDSENLGIGLSTHSPNQALRSIAANPDYVAIGPVFSTETKPQAPAVTLDYVRWAAENLTIPWYAIGGITLTSLESVLSAGAKGICVVSAILNHANPADACREFRHALDSSDRVRAS